MATSNLALDLMLKFFLDSTNREDAGDADYNDRSRMMSVVSKIVPGTTAYKCERRLEELRRELQIKSIRELTGTRSERFANETKIDDSSEPKSSKIKKTERGENGFEARNSKSTATESICTESAATTSDFGPVMVIHVYDEAKKLKRDFTCPHGLLVRDMKYFSDYLSSDSAQRLEDVDISVHCDVDIFDWLLRYVKRSLGEQEQHGGKSSVKLEPTNVISILISSDFLRMDDLVEECIRYCHDSMSEVLATSYNMNCIEDRLVNRIAQSFSASELDNVKDKKDKFKSKLFAKKVEALLSELCGSDNSNGSLRLFRCSTCKKILTNRHHRDIKCLSNRLTIGVTGHLAYRHSLDTSFDVNEWLLDLKDGRPWSEVYWSLWSLLNSLTCSKCGQLFQCCDLSTCRYHPQSAVYETKDHFSPGFYPCCGQLAARFDPALTNTGCRTRDHVYNSADNQCESSAQCRQIYEELMSHRDIISSYQQKQQQQQQQQQPQTKLPDSSKYDHSSVPTLTTLWNGADISGETSVESQSCFSNNYNKIMSKVCDKSLSSAAHDVPPDDKLDEASDDDNDDDDDDDDEQENKKIVQRKSLRVSNTESTSAVDSTTSVKAGKLGEWDSSRSVRYNQDSQREADQRRMKEIINYLSNLRYGTNKQERMRQREYCGGLYSRLENQWKQVNSTGQRSISLSLRKKSRHGVQPVK